MHSFQKNNENFTHCSSYLLVSDSVFKVSPSLMMTLHSEANIENLYQFLNLFTPLLRQDSKDPQSITVSCRAVIEL